jgi:hypothetical protein
VVQHGDNLVKDIEEALGGKKLSLVLDSLARIIHEKWNEVRFLV